MCRIGTVALWGMEDGLSIEEVADQMGKSVEMVQDSPRLASTGGAADVVQRRSAAGQFVFAAYRRLEILA